METLLEEAKLITVYPDDAPGRAHFEAVRKRIKARMFDVSPTGFNDYSRASMAWARKKEQSDSCRDPRKLEILQREAAVLRGVASRMSSEYKNLLKERKRLNRLKNP